MVRLKIHEIYEISACKCVYVCAYIHMVVQVMRQDEIFLRTGGNELYQIVMNSKVWWRVTNDHWIGMTAMVRSLCIILQDLG